MTKRAFPHFFKDYHLVKKKTEKKRKIADRILQLQVSGLQLYWKRDCGVLKFLRTHLHNISL